MPDVPEQHDFEPKISEPCIVIWDEQDGRKWFVAMCRKRVDSQHFLMEHLEQAWLAQAKRCWQYPSKPDEQITLLDQIIPVTVLGAWNLKGRSFTFELDNWHVIDGIFKGLYNI